MLRIDLSYHQKIENLPLYKELREAVLSSISEHTCCADDGRNYDESDGFFVSGKEEAAMFIADYLHKTIAEAWEDGWRVRNKSCGLSKQNIIIQKKDQYAAFKSALINDIEALKINQ